MLSAGFLKDVTDPRWADDEDRKTFTRENIMRQAVSLKDFKLPLLLPGSAINTSATDYRVIKYMKLQRFNGKSWEFAD